MLNNRISLILFAFATPALAQDEPASRVVETANAGFEQATAEGGPASWYGNTLAPDSPGPGYVSLLDRQNPASGDSSLKIASVGQPAEQQFGTLSQALDIRKLRGRRVRLSALVRTSDPAPDYAGLWLRVDRPVGLPSFLDNMGDRPIASADWGRYSVEAEIPADTLSVYYGFAIGGTGAAWIDDVRVEDIGPAPLHTIEDPNTRPGPPRAGPIEGDVAPRAIDERGLTNLQAFARLYGLVRWFHPTRQAMSTDWTQFLIAHVPSVEAAEDPDQLAEILKRAFGPIAPSLRIAVNGPVDPAPIPESEQHIRWRHTGYAEMPNPVYGSATEIIATKDAPAHWSETLPGGVAIDLPLSVPIDAMRRTLPLGEDEIAPDMRKPAGWLPAGFDRTTRIAGIVSAWALLDHFYPYWDVVETDWDAEFGPLVQQAALAQDDIENRDVIRQLIERLHDGHGNVFYRYDAAYMLPIDWAWIDGQLVVTGFTPDAAGIEPGMIVREIDGVTADTAFAKAMSLISGSDHSKRYRAQTLLRASHAAGERKLRLEDAAGQMHDVTLSFRRATREDWHIEPRPEKLVELEPGLLYADLTRITNDDLDDAMNRFATADSIIFDLRGYPRAPWHYLKHMTDVAIRSAAMNTGIQTRPDAVFDSFRDGGWTIEPALPGYTGKIVFITDGSAGSYPESILGTVKANGLGTIIGSATAGANGNYARFRLPGGYQIQWTGMQVINRDGSRHHNIGVLPDITVEPTLRGVREGRDELLEAAVAEIRRQMIED